MPQEGGRGGATATMGQHVGKENERPDADFDVGKRAVAVPTGVVFGTSSAMEASTPQDARKFKDVISNAESNVARLAEVMDSAEQEIEAAFRRTGDMQKGFHSRLSSETQELRKLVESQAKTIDVLNEQVRVTHSKYQIRLRDSDARMAELEAEAGALRRDRDAEGDVRAKLKMSSTMLQERLDEARKARSDAEDALKASHTEVSTLRGALAKAAQAEGADAEASAALRARLEAMARDFDALRASLDGARAENGNLRADLKAAARDADAKSAELARAKRCADDLSTRVIEADAEKARLTKALASAVKNQSPQKKEERGEPHYKVLASKLRVRYEREAAKKAAYKKRLAEVEAALRDAGARAQEDRRRCEALEAKLEAAVVDRAFEAPAANAAAMDVVTPQARPGIDAGDMFWRIPATPAEDTGAVAPSAARSEPWKAELRRENRRLRKRLDKANASIRKFLDNSVATTAWLKRVARADRGERAPRGSVCGNGWAADYGNLF